MSTNPSCAKEPSDQTANSAPVGIDPLYSDCIIKSKSGSLFYTLTGCLVTESPVFREAVESRWENPSAFKVRTLKSSDSTDETDSLEKVMELPLDDPDEEIQALVEHLHQPHRLVGSLIPRVTKEGADRVLRLAAVSFKYNVEGALRQIDILLGRPSSVAQFISHHDDGNPLATSEFASRYRLKSVLQAVESHMQSRASGTTAGLDEALSRASRRPSPSAEMRLCRQMSLLSCTTQRSERRRCVTRATLRKKLER